MWEFFEWVAGIMIVVGIGLIIAGFTVATPFHIIGGVVCFIVGCAFFGFAKSNETEEINRKMRGTYLKSIRRREEKEIERWWDSRH